MKNAHKAPPSVEGKIPALFIGVFMTISVVCLLRGQKALACPFAMCAAWFAFVWWCVDHKEGPPS